MRSKATSPSLSPARSRFMAHLAFFYNCPERPFGIEQTRFDSSHGNAYNIRSFLHRQVFEKVKRQDFFLQQRKFIKSAMYRFSVLEAPATIVTGDVLIVAPALLSAADGYFPAKMTERV